RAGRPGEQPRPGRRGRGRPAEAAAPRGEFLRVRSRRGGGPMKHLVVIPAYNEEEALPRTVAALDELPAEYEILIVHDGSGDLTGAVADGLAAGLKRALYVVHLPMNSGIGAAVQTGYLFAVQRGGYAYVIQFDGDGQHPAEAIPALVAECRRRDLD